MEKPPFRVTTADGLYDNAHACLTSARESAARATEAGHTQVRIIDADGRTFKPTPEDQRVERFG